MPTLSTAYFAHYEITLHDPLPMLRKSHGKYFEELLLHTDAPIVDDRGTWRKLTNLLNKPFILHNSDGQNELGCLRHNENLSK